jgi:hypothetical protein
MKNLYKIEDELYIISSSEKIKENTQSFKEGLDGDWFYNTIYNFIARTGDITSYDFKIILTTDKLLIKDGVQAIDDEFLEWFVNNQTCESVEVEKVKIINYAFPRSVYDKYKIIIPSEEPKRKIDTCYNFNKEIGCVQIDCRCEQEEPKQETLEEVADKWVFETNDHKWSNNNNEAGDNFGSFIAGFKEAEKTLYSEEEVLTIIQECKSYLSFGDEFDEIKWFEQFKKK